MYSWKYSRTCCSSKVFTGGWLTLGPGPSNAAERGDEVEEVEEKQEQSTKCMATAETEREGQCEEERRNTRSKRSTRGRTKNEAKEREETGQDLNKAYDAEGTEETKRWRGHDRDDLEMVPKSSEKGSKINLKWSQNASNSAQDRHENKCRKMTNN